jgi:hypothetical protein
MKPCRYLIFLLTLTLSRDIYAQTYSQDFKTDLIRNSSWELSYIRSTETDWIMSYTLSNKIILTFNDSWPLVKLKSICNSGIGRYVYLTSNDSVEFKIAFTLINCPDIWDDYVTKSFAYAYKCVITGGELIIYSNGAYNLYFKECKKP